jgi:hypothetical protein
MPLEIHEDSHLDHGLSQAHVDWLLEKYSDRGGFFIETVALPEELDSVPCGLYGPLMDDEPVGEDQVTYKVRGERKCASRLVNLPARENTNVSIIAGPYGDDACVLYTAFGGPIAPKEPGDLSLDHWDDIVKSREFWAEHALSAE